jgi:hypothetical protein
MEKLNMGPQLFRFVKFHSQLHIWCPMMPILGVLAPESHDFADNFHVNLNNIFWYKNLRI